MHKNSKRALSLLLALVMLLGSVPALTFASSGETTDAPTGTTSDGDYDYSSLYVRDGLVFLWTGFDLKEGDAPLTALENQVGDTDVSLTDATVHDRYLYTKNVLDFTSFIPHEMMGDNGEIFVADDMSIEIVLRQIDEKPPAPTSSDSASVSAAQRNGTFKVPTLSGVDVRAYNLNEISGVDDWQNKYPIDESYGFISDTYATLTPFSGTSSIQLATDVNWNKVKWLGNTRYEVYTVGLVLDYAKEETDKTLGKISASYVRDGVSVLSKTGNYDARYYGNWLAASGQKVATKDNQIFRFGGLGFGYSAIRYYTKALTSAEIARNHTVDLLAYYGIDPALYTSLSEKKQGDADAALSSYLLGATSKEAVEDVLAEIAIPSVDELYMDLYVQDGLIFRWDGFDLNADGTKISSIRSMLGDGKVIDRQTGGREAKDIGTDGQGSGLSKFYSYDRSALFGAPYADPTQKTVSLNSQLILTPLIPWRQDASGISLPSDMTLEVSMAYPSVYKTAPDANEVTNVAGWNGGVLYLGPLGMEGNGVGYNKPNANQPKGNGAISDAVNAPLDRWSGALTGLDSGNKLFLGNSLNRTFHAAITFNYDEEATDYTNIPYTFHAVRDGFAVMERDSFYSKDTDYSVSDGTSTQMQLTFGVDVATQFYTIRMYDRALSESEIQQNHTVDLFKYYEVDTATYKSFDQKTRERLHAALAPYQIGETTKEELEAILANFALTGGVLGVIDISDYIDFLGVQARTDDYAAIRLRYAISRDKLKTLDEIGAVYSFGAMYAKKDSVDGKEDMTVVFNPAISEFIKAEGDFVCVPAYHNGEFSGKLDYLDADGEKIDFGVMLPPVSKDALASGAQNDEYYARGYLAVYLNNAYFVLYLDTEDGAFGETLTIAEVSEYFVCNGYAFSEIPSLLADPHILAGAQASEDLYRELDADHKNMEESVAMLNGAYAGAIVSESKFQEIDTIMANINIGDTDNLPSYAKAVEYARISATARGELNVYFDLGLKAYEQAKATAEGVGAKLEARSAATKEALLAVGLDEETASAMTATITGVLESTVSESVLTVETLDASYEKLIAIKGTLESSMAELKLSKIISATSSLFIEGTTVARHTIITSSEYLAVAEMFQQFLIARQGAFIGIYQIDNAYVGGMHDFSGTKAIYVGLTDKHLTEGDTFSVYYDKDLSALCIEGKTVEALTAGASAFLHQYAIGKGRLTVTADKLGTSLVNQSYLPMYTLNTQTEFPKINISSVSVDGVWEGFMQRLSELPEHVTVVPKLKSEDFAASNTLTFFVSKDGDDQNDGSFEHPFATLERALEATAFTGGASILIRGGFYSLDKTVTLKAEHSGSLTAPLFISNYQDEEVVFTTGKTIASESFVPADQADFLPEGALNRLNAFKVGNSANVYAVNLAALGVTADDLSGYASGEKAPGLYLGETSYRVSRWPNVGANDEELLITNGDVQTMASQADVKEVGRVTDGISSLYEQYKNNTNEYFELYIDETTYVDHLLAYDQDEVAAKRLWMHGSVYEEWDNINANMTLHKTSDGKNYMKSQARSNYGVKFQKDNTVFFYNMLEDLDQNEEYLVDTENLILYIYADQPLSDGEMTLCYATHSAFELDGVSHAVLSGLTVKQGYGYGVHMKNADYALVQDCVFRSFSGYAILMADCTQSGVTYSEFYSCNGVETTSSAISDLHPTRNFIQNNRFTNAGDTHAMTVGVRFSGVADVISHNYFYETRLNVQRSYECVIEYNEFDRGPQYNKDTGPIYTNDNTRALHIRYNYLHDLSYSCYGIYLDDMTSGVYVYGNVVHYGEDGPADGRCVNLHNSSMCVIMNNVCIGARYFGIVNNINYYAATVNGVETGGGGLGYRISAILRSRLAVNGNYLAEDVRYDRFPMYAAYTDVVNRVILQIDANPSWNHSNKLSPAEDDELYVRTPLYNIYTNNVFYDCWQGLNIPTVGRSTGRVGANISYASTDKGIFTDPANGDWSVPANSKIYESMPNFEATDMTLVGVLED